MNWPLVLTALLFVNLVAFVIAMRITGGYRADLEHQRDYYRDRVEALTNDLLAMRRDGFDVRKPAKITEPVDEETAALRKAEGLLVRGMKADDNHFISQATQRIMRDRGVSPAVAHAEAVKLRRSITDEDPPV